MAERGAAVRRGLLLSLAFAVGSPAAADREAELQQLRERIERMRQELQQSEGRKGEARDALAESERNISSKNRLLRQLGQRREARNAELVALRRQAEAMRKNLPAQRAALARLLQRRYLQGEASAVKLLLSGANPAEISRGMAYLGYVARAQAQTIDRTRGRLRQMNRAGRVLQVKAQELAELAQEAAREQRQLLAEKAERQRTFGKLAARITAQRREIGAMQRDEKRLSQLIERLARIVSSDKPVSRGLAAALPEPGRFAALRGRLRLPVRGEVSNRFGAPRHDSGVPWKGVFLRAAEGSEVRAVADGRVVFADWMRGFGNLMIVDHDDGYLSIYGNNEALLKQIGERVGGGESLATVGSSGGNTQSGLYFEIRHKGRAIDPLTWVGKK